MCRRILVVEDSKTFRNFLKQQLQQGGFTPVFAANVEEAQLLIAQDNNFLCAVLDYCLPDGQDGEIIDIVLGCNIKSVVLTAQFSQAIREKVLAKGVLDYLLKDSAESVSYLVPLLQRLQANDQHKVLVVDDSTVVRNYLVNLLERQNLTTVEAENGNDAIIQLSKHTDISLIITDNDMPEKDGITLTREVRKLHSRNQIAILGLSASSDDSMTAQFLKAGANDFLYKPFNQEEFNCRLHHILNMKDTADKLYRMANQDALTGLWNRRYFFNQQCKPHCHQPNIAMMDIDFFKKVNDTYGHDGGDTVLVHISQLLQRHFKDAIVARFGGEEFCIQLCGPFDTFQQRLELLRRDIEAQQITYKNGYIQVTMSVGAVSANADCFDIDGLLSIADKRLYCAKENGRNQVVSTTP
ncbi:diguanylate cyclase [Photobacterium swingsii]|uniref:GGDEF domain-containing response regulator n=1 Tax=Photobacterium swingsii TaxID=680026 RepID=UPI00352C9D82